MQLTPPINHPAMALLDAEGCNDLPLGYLTLTETGLIITANATAADLLKTDQSALIDKPFEQWIATEDSALFQQRYQALLEQQQPQSFELRMTCTHRSPLMVKLSMKLRFLAPRAAPRVQVFFEKLSYDPILKQELALAWRQIELANQAKSHFLGVMNQEIRTPLNVILGYSELLAEQGEELQLPKHIVRDLAAIQAAGRHLAELLNNILDLSKMEANKLNICLEPLELKSLLYGVYQLNKEQADSKQQHFIYECVGELPDYIISDRIRLTQILTNLVHNAIKFTPQHKTIELRVERLDNHLQFTVADQGIGIAPEHQTQIFDAFKQVDMSATRYFGGTGLGLALVKKLVELLDGTLSLTSKLDQGSVFTIRLPLLLSELPDFSLA